MSRMVTRRWVEWPLLAFLLLAMLPAGMGAPRPAAAVVGAYVELHVAVCPPGYSGDTLFADCHENRVPGIAFVAEGAGGERYEAVTDANGVAFFNDFFTAGPLTIIEQVPSGAFSGYTMFCSTVADGTTLPVESRGNGRAAAMFELPQAVIDAGSGVICDWYYFSPAPSEPTGSIEVHVSACPAGVDEGNLFDACHANGLSGLQYRLDGPVSREGVTAGPLGAVLWSGLPAGTYTVAESLPNPNFAEYIVVCSDQGGTAVPFEYRGNGRAAVQLELAPGQAIVCDWFNVPPAPIVVSPDTTTVPATRVPVTEAPAFAIGLTRQEWEEIHGSGTLSGDVTLYENGRYAVAFQSGMVTFVETGWEADGGLEPGAANAVVRALLPPDAVLQARYALPATPEGPIGLVAEQYHSNLLQERLRDAPLVWNGSILVVYQQEVGSPEDEPRLMRVSIAAGTGVIDA